MAGQAAIGNWFVWLGRQQLAIGLCGWAGSNWQLVCVAGQATIAREAEGTAQPLQEGGKEKAEAGGPILMEDEVLDQAMDASAGGTLLETERDRLIRLVRNILTLPSTKP